jgi:hypothetical protein
MDTGQLRRDVQWREEEERLLKEKLRKAKLSEVKAGQDEKDAEDRGRRAEQLIRDLEGDQEANKRRLEQLSYDLNAAEQKALAEKKKGATGRRY